ncbi:MAG: 30S ribosomal protein S14 [Armatimonadetes bacterium]|nr:30S ribosomal protein S14 [Armatimonadota bacterium]
MARESWKERQKRREKTVAKYAEIRKELKDKKDYEGLAKLPRDASPTRLKNRCSITGRAHGFIRVFGISRIVFREFAHRGLLPGVRKASY